MESKKNETSSNNESRCSICGKYFISSHLDIHHVRPANKDDLENMKNIILVCAKCNSELHASENNRLAGAGIGGAMLGASIGGPAGAIIGGLIGLFMGDSVNKSKKENIDG